MAITLDSGPLAGFDRPIDLLVDCHRRIERFLDVLIRVAARAADSPDPLDEEHLGALKTSVEYFDAAAPRHTEDEERSLFPLLRQSEDPAARAAMARVEQLEAEHAQAERLHEQVNQLAGRLLAERKLPVGDAQVLLGTLRQLRELYRHHIAAEEQVVFPVAREALSEAQLQRIGGEMAGRRAARRVPMENGLHDRAPRV